MCRGREERKEAGLESLDRAWRTACPLHQEERMKERVRGSAPSEPCHCLHNYTAKSVSEQRFPLTAACALRLGRCVRAGFPSCPGHGAAAVHRASTPGIFCLPVRPTSHLASPHRARGPPAVGLSWPASTPAGSCHIQPHQHQQMGTVRPSLSRSAGLSSPHRRLTGQSAVVWLLRGGTHALICPGSEPA